MLELVFGTFKYWSATSLGLLAMYWMSWSSLWQLWTIQGIKWAHDVETLEEVDVISKDREATMVAYRAVRKMVFRAGVFVPVVRLVVLAFHIKMTHQMLQIRKFKSEQDGSRS